VLDLVALTSLASARLGAIGDPDKAPAMAAYLKTDMPFYGVQTPQRAPILRELVASFPPATGAEYEAAVRALWGLPHREEKYLALGYAARFDGQVTFDRVGLYRDLIVSGAWWDLSDTAAIGLFGRVLFKDRARATPVARTWVVDQDLWLRRTAIICQVGHKGEADESLLFDACRVCMDQREFFIRKAIGWALRDHARSAPQAVASFAAEHREHMSGLSYREATKHLG
jgi:3-methyladenine DNA glycosylase AlkD